MVGNRREERRSLWNFKLKTLDFYDIKKWRRKKTFLHFFQFFFVSMFVRFFLCCWSSQLNKRFPSQIVSRGINGLSIWGEDKRRKSTMNFSWNVDMVRLYNPFLSDVFNFFFSETSQRGSAIIIMSSDWASARGCGQHCKCWEELQFVWSNSPFPICHNYLSFSLSFLMLTLSPRPHHSPVDMFGGASNDLIFILFHPSLSTRHPHGGIVIKSNNKGGKKRLTKEWRRK